MTHLLVTSIRRHTPHTAPSGFIYLIDAEAGRVVRRCTMIEPAYREADNNPRGGMRGGRGISVRNDQIAIANASVVYRYDPQWNLLGILSHPSAAAIHDVMFGGPSQNGHGDTLWLTAARNDLVMQFDLAGNLLRHFYLRSPSPALRSLEWKPPVILRSEGVTRGAIEFRDPRTHEEETYDRAHVNSICALPDGGLLVSMGLVLGTKFSSLLQIKSRMVKAGVWPALLSVNRGLRRVLGMKKNMHSDLLVQPARAQSAVIRLDPDGAHRLVLALDGATVPSHSLLVLRDGTTVYMNTTAGEVVHFNPATGEVLSTTKVTDGFLRGAAQLSDRTLLLGSKREIITFDLRDRRVVDTLTITEDVNESVYDIKILPPHYGLPPESFEDHFVATNGFKGEDLPKYSYKLPTLKSPQVNLNLPLASHDTP